MDEPDKKKLEEKKAAFAENPDRFWDRADIAIAVVRIWGENGEFKGFEFPINDGTPDTLLKAIAFDITEVIKGEIIRRRMMIEAENAKSGIITPDNPEGK